MSQIQHLCASIGVAPAKKWHAQTQKESFISTQKHQDGLLENYLNTLGRQNLTLINFGAQNPIINKQRPLCSTQVTPFDTDFTVEAFRPGISNYAKWKIRTEATNRIYGKKKWPNIKNINAWFVTAETQKFMAIGGLAKVAEDLPNSFNKRFANDAKNNMRCITPIYTYKDNMGIIEKNGQKYYKYGQYVNPKTQQIEPITLPIKKVTELTIPIYNPNTNTKLQDTRVEIYKGYTYDSAKPGEKPNNDGTEYIFLHTPPTRLDENGKKVPNAQIFNTEAMDPNSEGNKTPYAYSKSGTDELTRMVFLSKTVYELIKKVKAGNIEEFQAPNILFLNDWHAGPLAALVNYQANADADIGEISHSTGKYFDTLPMLYLAHNVEHQGSTTGDAGKRASVFATLFGEHGTDIITNAKSWRNEDPEYNPKPQDKNALLRYSDFNCAVAGMMLSDRIIPVSTNYGEELLHSENKAKGFKDLFNARAFSPFTKTFTPITNGYSKELIEPNQKHMDSILKQAEKDLTLKGKKPFKLDDIKLKAFENGEIENKVHNKNEVMKIIKRILEREKYLTGVEHDYSERRYFMHDPANTEIPDLKDYSKVPIVTFVGRFDPQKGLNNILKDALWQFAEENKDKKTYELPIFIIGGKITQQSSYDAIKQMKDEMRDKGGIYSQLAKRIVLFKGYVNTNLLATAADLFLIPSVFEPCGLTQMEAMAKGALPVTTSTGGLVDTIDDEVNGFRTKAFFDQDGWETKERIYGEGFNTNGEAYCECLTRAIDTFKNNQDKFKQMQKNAIAKDFSWNAPGGAIDKYISLMKTGKIAA